MPNATAQRNTRITCPCCYAKVWVATGPRMCQACGTTVYTRRQYKAKFPRAYAAWRRQFGGARGLRWGVQPNGSHRAIMQPRWGSVFAYTLPLQAVGSNLVVWAEW